MAHRRALELSPGVKPFDRAVAEWRELGAPVWLFKLAAGMDRYVEWAVPCYGGGTSAGRYTQFMVSTSWWPLCVCPQWLAHVGALSSSEARLLTGDPYQHWGRPGRCPSRLLRPTADVPEWLLYCRQDVRRGA